MHFVKKGFYYLLMSVIWALGTLAWAGSLVKDAEAGALNGFHIVAAVCSVICVVLNLVVYFRARKQEK